MNKSLISTSAAILLVTTIAVTFASSVDIPNTFTAGTTAVAAEVNENFNAVETSVNDNADAISDLQITTASQELQLVGFTEDSFIGRTGVLDFTKACRVAFPGSRMCTSTEIMNTTAVPVLVGGTAAWVRPDIITNTGTGLAIDASGVQAEADNLSCNGWNQDEFTGLSVSLNGSFGLVNCLTQLRVACCLVGP